MIAPPSGIASGSFDLSQLLLSILTMPWVQGPPHWVISESVLEKTSPRNRAFQRMPDSSGGWALGEGPPNLFCFFPVAAEVPFFTAVVVVRTLVSRSLEERHGIRTKENTSLLFLLRFTIYLEETLLGLLQVFCYFPEFLKSPIISAHVLVAFMGEWIFSGPYSAILEVSPLSLPCL